MMSKKISGYQLAIILYLCRSYTTLTHTAGEQNIMVVIYSIIGSMFIQFLLLAPAFFLYKNYKTTNIITISSHYSKPLSITLGIMTSLFCLSISLDTFTSFYTFMTSTVFPYANQFTLIFWMFLVVIYAVLLGLHPIIRTSVLIFPFTLFVLFTIYGFAFKDANFIFWKPILENAVSDISKHAMLLSLRNFELIPLIYLLDRVSTSKKATVVNFIVGFTLIQELRMISILFILGDYRVVQQYPSYALASLVEASIFQRLDSLYTIIWVFMAFIKLALFIWLCIDVLKQVLPKKMHSYLLPFASIILIGSTILKNNYYTTTAVKTIYFISTSFLIFLLIIVPLLLLVPLLFKDRRTKQ